MSLSTPSHTLPADFALRLINWQRTHGRHDLPWQTAPGALPDAYAIWVSEIMLQQTQVETVIPYYRRFMARFPAVGDLAAAPEDEVMRYWAGLGYYSRARNLHAAAQDVVMQHGGRFPAEATALMALPGIGRSTAAAIAVFAFGARHAILDGNVKRVLARLAGVTGWPGDKAVETRLWMLAEASLPPPEAGSAGLCAYIQGQMDLGATVCTRARPRCTVCPFRDDCVAAREGRQASLPEARPKKAVPQRETAMLVLLHAGEVLLEKRPAPGIWGGLWSLPECAAENDVASEAARFGVVTQCARLAPLAHAFTHFRLHIQPWRIELQRAACAEAPGRLWLPLDALDGAALPTPVRRILSRLAVAG